MFAIIKNSGGEVCEEALLELGVKLDVGNEGSSRLLRTGEKLKNKTFTHYLFIYIYTHQYCIFGILYFCLSMGKTLLTALKYILFDDD